MASLSVVWYKTKAELFAAKNSPYIIASLDVSHDPRYAGAKKFAAFDSTAEFTEYATASRKSRDLKRMCMYEVIPSKNGMETYLMMDFDLAYDATACPYLACNTASVKVVESIIKYLRAMLHEHYGTTCEPIIGHNVQVLDGSKPGKVSLHIRPNIICSSWAHAGSVVSHLVDYITAHASNEDALYLFSPGVPAKCGIDTSIYGEFRSMRLCGHAKLKANNMVPLRPFPGCSKHIKDHLVVVYHDNPQDNTIRLEHIPKGVITSSVRNDKRDQSAGVMTLSTSTGQKKINNTFVVPQDLLDQALAKLCECSDILDLLKVPSLRFNHDQTCMLSHKCARFKIHKDCGHVCPLAERRHGSNLSFFDYNHDTKAFTYSCYNEKCQKKPDQIQVHIVSRQGLLVALSDRDAQHSLLCRDKVLDWNQVYSEPEMRDYPTDKPIVAVQGGMGVGKTKALIKYIEALDKETSVLILTYGRTISGALAAQLKSAGFINYLDVKGPILNDRAIVCIDSSHRVAHRVYSVVIIDEMTCTMGHFQSPFMKHDNVCRDLAEQCTFAERVLFLCATVSNTMSVLAIENIAESRHQPVFWIKNTYVRETNRNACIIVNGSCQKTKAMQDALVTDIMIRLKAGARIVVPTTSKTFAEVLQEAVMSDDALKDKRVKVYHSETDREQKCADLANIQEAWAGVDLLVYSPTIGAAISFEQDNFTACIAYAENNVFSPACDVFLQMLFRVRCLSKTPEDEYNMKIYIDNAKNANNDNASKETRKRPLSLHSASAELLRRLDKARYTIGSDYKCDKSNIANEWNQSPWHDGFPSTEAPLAFEPRSVRVRCPSTGRMQYKFDTEDLSYAILLGLYYMKRKSTMHYPNIMRNMLKSHYGIENDFMEFGTEDKENKGNNEGKKCNDVRALFEAVQCARVAKVLPFSPKVIITSAQYKTLKQSEMDDEALSDLQKQQLHTYEMCNHFWKFQKPVDTVLYDTCIFPCTRAGITKARDTFFCAMRFSEARMASIAECKEDYAWKLAEINEQASKNFKLANGKVHDYYAKLVWGMRFLLAALGGHETRRTLFDKYYVEVPAFESNQRIMDLAKQMTPEEKALVIKVFKLPGRTYKTDTFCTESKGCGTACMNIIASAFCIDGKTLQDKVTRALDARAWLHVKQYDPNAVVL